MHKLKTGESFMEDGYTVTRLGASKEDSPSDWALFCVATGECNTCAGGICPAKEGTECKCEKTHVHTWVKKGHSFSAGNKVCKLEESSREESCLAEGDMSETGIGDC